MLIFSDKGRFGVTSEETISGQRVAPFDVQ